ncbi:MAG: hypothetical protein QOE14_904 [Humisphaera sp.]|nr:hypothetical protein [Humisphaera sp.]
MQAPEVNCSVRLLQDIPELGLRCGEVGVVCSTWFAPEPAYEVEFQPRGSATRALVMQNQIQPADDHQGSD